MIPFNHWIVRCCWSMLVSSQRIARRSLDADLPSRAAVTTSGIWRRPVPCPRRGRRLDLEMEATHECSLSHDVARMLDLACDSKILTDVPKSHRWIFGVGGVGLVEVQ